MSIVRAPRPDAYFTVLRNEVIRDKRLSYRARGLLAHILSLPDDWRTDSTQLANDCPNGEGREAVRTALRELRECGYLHQRKAQRDDGRWVTESVVYDTPTEDGFPGVGLPDVGSPGALQRTETKKPRSSSSDSAPRGHTRDKPLTDEDLMLAERAAFHRREAERLAAEDAALADVPQLSKEEIRAQRAALRQEADA